MSEVLLLLGGNEGNKHKIFSETLGLISQKVGTIHILSSIYETEPWGFVSDLFWNQALSINTNLKPDELLNCIQEIENIMGRKRLSNEYESRPIDIDIMFYDDLKISSSTLTIPHPLIQQRKFVLIPLAEIASDKIHPTTGLTINEMLEMCLDPLKVTRIES